MFAAIDVGSNTVRLLLGDVVQGQVRPLRYERSITRLKGAQSADMTLSPASMERTFVALQAFNRIVNRYNPASFRIVGTEALRSAPNSAEFKNRVQRELGLELEIISGTDEGCLCSAGVLSVLEPAPEQAIIVDIGGGSTEIVTLRQRQVLSRHSYTLGVVRLAELATDQQRQQLIDAQVQLMIERFRTDSFFDLACDPETAFVGTAGTLTTLAALDLAMSDYDWQRVNNHSMDSERIDYFLKLLHPLKVAERERLPGMEEGRGDLIVHGLTLLQKLMYSLTKKKLIISDSGLLEGVLLQMAADVANH